jgi:hypothetical protein
MGGDDNGGISDDDEDATAGFMYVFRVYLIDVAVYSRETATPQGQGDSK